MCDTTLTTQRAFSPTMPFILVWPELSPVFSQFPIVLYCLFQVLCIYFIGLFWGILSALLQHAWGSCHSFQLVFRAIYICRPRFMFPKKCQLTTGSDFSRLFQCFLSEKARKYAYYPFLRLFMKIPKNQRLVLYSRAGLTALCIKCNNIMKNHMNESQLYSLYFHCFNFFVLLWQHFKW